MDQPARLACPLCKSSKVQDFHNDRQRDYYRCTLCRLVFVPPDQRLGRLEEKAVYDLHQNDPADQGYRQFLSRIFFPLIERIETNATGLDFGSGPGPALPQMLFEEGYTTEMYDPFYANNVELLERSYDFITCTETVEHFYHPAREFDLLFSLLKPGGWLGIMTKLVINQRAFSTWHYKNDRTHVCFFSRETFSWLADRYRSKIESIAKDVI